MSDPTAISVSEAAEALHPGLSAAVVRAGGILLEAGDTAGTLVVLAAEGRGNVTIARDVQPRRRVGEAGMELAFAAADRAFAAALIVAYAVGDVPAAADPASVALNRLAARVAQSDVTVLINGPTGTGKEVLARYLHARSPRHSAPFVAVNCAALPEAMLEALLFGHERGAFTGAAVSARGLFRSAEGGTILLDEVAELPLGMQAKLLRTLQEREVLAIGSTVPQKIDVRIVAAANRDLTSEVAAGRFRADLFYRLAVFPLVTTALAGRSADIVAIAAALHLRSGARRWPSTAALSKLEAYNWPGNVRELGNVLARAEVFADGQRIEARDIVFDAATRMAEAPASLGGAVRQREYDVIRATLADCAGRRVDAAHRLGISERTLRYKLAAMSGSVASATRSVTLQ